MSPDEIERRAAELASWPVHVGVILEGGEVVGDAVLPAAAPVVIGSDADVTVAVEGRADIARVEVSETRADGVYVHVAADANFQGQVAVAGGALTIRGKLAAARADHPELTSPVRVLSPKVIVRVGRVAVLLHRDPGFAGG